MLVTMQPNASDADIQRIVKIISKNGLMPNVINGEKQVVIGAVGKVSNYDHLNALIANIKSVERVMRIAKPYKLASKEAGNGNKVKITKTTSGGEINIVFGDKEIHTMAGPCAVESQEQMLEVAKFLSSLGVKFLRGGAFKPRTAPGCFEGLGEEGLKYLRVAANTYNMLVVTEFLDVRDAELMRQYADVVQIGTRNMQNFELLKEAGKLNLPVILKRGMSATIDEWLCSAEYILSEQNEKRVILCERGIRTFSNTHSRNTPDLLVIPIIKKLSWLPIIFDPSHSAGHRDLIQDISLGAIATGADGLIIEVHPDPDKSYVDGAQTLGLDEFQACCNKLKSVATAIDRSLS